MIFIKKSCICAQLQILLEGPVLIILFQLYGSNDGLFKDDLFWVGQYDLPSLKLHVGRRTNPKLT